MKPEIEHELCLANDTSFAQPFYFKSGESHLFAWLHRPTKPAASKLGVVICSPYGYESICAHRSVRQFAESLAAGGIPALRFDYRSTGDSSEIDEHADHVTLWTQDVGAAIRELRSRAGVEHICLLGIRLGSLLASLAAAEPGVADSLILIGPVVSGRRFVRELRTTQLAGMAMAGQTEIASAPEHGNAAAKTLEAGGFSFSGATLDSLARVDLLGAPAPAVRSITVLDNDKLPSAKRWIESLAAANIELEYKTLPGLIEMAMTAPQFATVPRDMIDFVCQSLSRMTLKAEASPAETSDGRKNIAEALAPMVLELPLSGDQSPQSSLRERPVFISAGVPLFGIVTEPHREEKRRRAVILLNPGADFHIGASRMYVSLARRWAARGYVVLRLDFAGIGDSATRPGNVDDEVFPVEAIDDIREAVAFMRSRYAITDMTLAGLCSGAYHALRAAAAGVPVNRILLVNPQNYFWKKGMTLEQVQLVEVAHNPGLYRRRMFSRDAWRRMLRGQVDVRRIAVIYLKRARLASESRLRALARRLRIRLPEDLAWDLQKIVAMGIRITFVFARGEPGIELLKLQAGSMPHRLGERCRVRIVDSGDHIFSRREPRSMMENVLSEELFTRANDTPASGGSDSTRVCGQPS